MAAPLVRRELRARPGRLLLVGSTVVVAVAFCVGAFGFSQQVEALIAPPTVGADLQLPEGSVVLRVDTNSITTPTALDAELLARVRRVSGVAQADADYDQPLAFVEPHGAETNRPPVLRGVVLSSVSDPRAWRIAAGRFPVGPYEVAVDAGGAAVAGAALGQRTDLKLPTGTVRVTVVGLVASRRPSVSADAPTASTVAGSFDAQAVVALSSAHVLLDPDWAPLLLDAAGRADRITVIPLPGINPQSLARRVRRAVPKGIEVLAATSREAQTQQSIAAIDADVRSATIAYAGLTMLVAGLVIANSYSVLVAQRTRELGLLRLVGASRPQIARVVLGEAAVVGLLGAIVGGGLGSVFAFISERIVRVADIEVRFTVTWTMAVVALVVGVTTSLLGSLWPAWRATRVAPLEALSDTRAGADRPARPTIPVVVAVGGLGVAAWQASRGAPYDSARLAAIGLGGVVGFIGVALLSRWVVVPLTKVLGWPVVHLTGITGRLGVGNTARQPSRTAGAASTLMVGLALVSTVATFGASTRQAIAAQVGAAGHADIYLERTGVVRVSTTFLERRLRQLGRAIADDVEISDVDGQIIGRHGATSQAVASDLGAAARVIDLGDVVGDPSPAVTSPGPDARVVMLSRVEAGDLGVGVGDRVTLQSISGETRSLRVVATYVNTAILGPAVVPLAVAREISADGTFELAAIQLRPQVPAALLQRFLARSMSSFPRIAVETPAGFAALSTSVADTVLRIIYVLLSGSLGIGLLGLATTLALSTHERRRELVMLRAVGASRGQLRAQLWLEASMVGAIAGLIGVGLGTVVGRVGVGFSPDSLGVSPAIPWAQLVGVAGAAVVMAWAVSLGVARRVSRVEPAEAGRIS